MHIQSSWIYPVLIYFRFHRTSELLASTPSTSRPDASQPAEVPPDLSETPSELQLDPGSPAPVTSLKRPLSADLPAATPPDKRPRAGASCLDDSDVQFVEEVRPDIQMVFSSQEPVAAVLAATADSQAGFCLSLSPTQSEEVMAPPRQSVSPLVPSPLAESIRESPVGPSGGGSVDTPTGTGVGRAGSPSASVRVGSPAAPPAEGSQPVDQLKDQPADQPADRPADPAADHPAAESSDLPGSQGFQPQTEAESAEPRLPHIQTPQVASSGDSASPPGGDTVFGHAQRLIEEQNRRQELRDRQPGREDRGREAGVEAGSEQQAVGTGEKSAWGAVEEDKPTLVTLEEDKPASATAGDKPVSVTLGKDKPATERPESIALEEDEPVLVATLTKRPLSVTLDEDESELAEGQGSLAPATGLAEEASTSTTSATKRQNGAATSAEEKTVAAPGGGERTTTDSQLGSQTTTSSLLANWRSVAERSPGRTTEVSEGPHGEPADRDADRKAAAAEKVAAAAAEEAVEAAAAAEVETTAAEVAAGSKTDSGSMEVEGSPSELAEDPLPGGSATQDPYRFHGTQSQETQPSRLRQPLKVSPLRAWMM